MAMPHWRVGILSRVTASLNLFPRHYFARRNWKDRSEPVHTSFTLDAGGERLYRRGAQAQAAREVAERARIHLVDTFAAILSGSRLLPGKRIIAYVKPLGGTREAGVHRHPSHHHRAQCGARQRDVRPRRRDR